MPPKTFLSFTQKKRDFSLYKSEEKDITRTDG